MRGRALREDMDDGLRLARELRSARRQRIEQGSFTGRRDEIQRIEQRREAQRAEAHAHAAEKLAAGEEIVLGIRR